MELQELRERITALTLTDSANRLDTAIALRPELAGLRFFAPPLVGCAAADDPIFAQMQSDPKIIGDVFRTPQEWLPGAKSVISLFFPKTETVRRSNYEGPEPSAEWLHARIEGQEFLKYAIQTLKRWLEEAGYQAVVPLYTPDFTIRFNADDPELPAVASSWSERHVAFAAGLGTFGLAKNLITEKGDAGRITSLVTDAEFPPTLRRYTDPYEYCTFCGACARRCPVGAISPERGKDVFSCKAHVEKQKLLYAPRYGCAKCQLRVPCETGIPKK